MRKKIIIGLVIAAALVSAAVLLTRKPAKDVDVSTQLLQNGGFETLTGEGLPQGWIPDAYVRVQGVTDFEVVPGRAGNGVSIRNREPNDARFYQTVQVEPDTLYCLKGFVRADAGGGRGANVSIQDVYVFSDPAYQTGEEWQELVLYGRTGKNQRELTVFARLGGYSGEATGWAMFDDLSLMAVEEVPSGFAASLWEEQETALPEQDDGKAGPAAPWLVLLMAFASLVMVAIAKEAQRGRPAPDLIPPKRERFYLPLLLFIAALSRMFVAASADGFPVDIGCFTGWANQMAAVGPGKFYTSGIFSDYPPGYMLLLWPIGIIGQWMGTGATEFMVKLPSIVSDLAIILLLYKTARSFTGNVNAVLLASLYAFSPLPYLAGAAWGQADSIPSLLLLISVLSIIKKRWKFALPVYVLAVLMKPQALMAGPLGLAVLVIGFAWDRDGKTLSYRVRDVLLGLLLSLLTAAFVILPFLNDEFGISDVFSLYGGTMNYYNYATVNAANLYFLFSKNWIGTAEAAPFLLRLTGVLTVLLPSVWHLIQTRREKASNEKIGQCIRRSIPILLALLPALAVLLPMSMSLMGTLMMISVFALVFLQYARGGNAGNLPLLAGVMLIGFSILGTMMHERYPFLAAALLCLAYLLRRDKRILILLVALTALCFLNTGVVLDRGVRIGGPDANLSAPELGLVSDSGWLEFALSALSLPITGYALYLGFALTKPHSRTLPLRAPDKAPDDAASSAPGAALPGGLLHAREPARFDDRDKLIVMIVTVLYGLLAFLNLGSFDAPQKPWVSTDTMMTATLDLGESRQFKLLYYGGIHWRDSDFTIEVSSDGTLWSSLPAQMQEGDCFSWRYHTESYQSGDGKPSFSSNPVVHAGRYVRVKADTIALTLMEMIARDASTGESILITPVTPGSTPLADEQGTLTGEPGWYNGMYFDEIYHGRTAYEQLNAIRGLKPNDVYETTHPPLGKLFMTFSLTVFGMTPFGWRFAGALAGVLMLPGMYMMMKLLTKRRFAALFAMLLMALDCMHFTQTRIATIDSFATLFIIYAYYYMFTYMLQDHWALPFRKTLRPLLFSGLMMGFAIASKWTGVYAGAGLAVLFGWSLAGSARQGMIAGKLQTPDLAALGDREAAVRNAAGSWKKRAVLTCLWCLLFFVAIPLCIYALSFIPVFMRTPGGFTIQKVLDANKNMLSYHAKPGLGMDHFFYSPWYEWPLAVKPMWYYAGGVKDGTASTILSFGNLAVWWGGLIAMLGLLFAAVTAFLRRRYARVKAPFDRGDPRPVMLLIVFLAQYLPWVLVPRGTYIYHYFPAVPFIILALGLWVDRFTQWNPKKAKRLAIGFLILAFLFFAAFFPYASGIRVPVWWLDAMKWFPSWMYY